MELTGGLVEGEADAAAVAEEREVAAAEDLGVPLVEGERAHAAERVRRRGPAARREEEEDDDDRGEREHRQRGRRRRAGRHPARLHNTPTPTHLPASLSPPLLLCPTPEGGFYCDGPPRLSLSHQRFPVRRPAAFASSGRAPRKERERGGAVLLRKAQMTWSPPPVGPQPLGFLGPACTDYSHMYIRTRYPFPSESSVFLYRTCLDVALHFIVDLSQFVLLLLLLCDEYHNNTTTI